MKIKIIGVGGAGINIINSVIDSKVNNVECYVVNTDMASFKRTKAENKILIGNTGFGVGGDAELGKKCATESIDKLKDMVFGADMVIITAGMGGGTGTGVAPIIAKLAKEQGILTVAVVSEPLKEEGSKRIAIATDGLKELKQNVDELFVVNNDKSYPIRDNKTSIDMLFKVIDDVLRISIETITNTIIEDNKNCLDIKNSLHNATNKLLKLASCNIYE